jgi:hypothetical protein
MTTPTIDEKALAALMLEPSEEFTAWTKTLDPKHWARYDLSACRLGWEAAKALSALGAEPVAWTFELARSIIPATKEYTNWGSAQLSFTEPNVPEGSVRNLRPLYAAPHPSPAISDEAVERAAKAMCAHHGYDPDEKMPNDGPRWRYYVPSARAALEAGKV